MSVVPEISTDVALLADELPIGDLLARRAGEPGERPFVVLPDDGVTLTYTAVHARARRLALALRGIGLRPGDRIAVALPNGEDAIIAWFACLLGGFVDSAVSPELEGSPMRYAIEKVGATAAITDPEHLESIAGVVAGNDELRVVCRDLPSASSGERFFDLGEIAADPPERELCPAGFTELASVRFTSGSTGMPKGIMMSPGHMRASAQMFCRLTGLDRDGVVYSPFPLHHVLASITGVLAALEAGATLSLARRFSARRFWPQVRDCGATVVQGLDPVVSILLKAPPSSEDRDHRVRCMYTAAGSYPEFEERFGVRLIRMFDMSELTVVAHYRPGETPREGSCGRASDLFEVAIHDEHDGAVDAGEVGELVVRPRLANVMLLGYYGDAEQTVAQWQNLWFHTGDMGRLDDDGYLYFTGRASDRIRHRGVNISPAQVEASVLEDPAVAECAAIAVPADVSEDEIKVCVRLHDGADADAPALGARLRESVPSHLSPRYLEIYEELPKTDTEKIRKGLLRGEGDDGLTERTWDAVQEDWVVR